jgi:hypothetical protein
MLRLKLQPLSQTVCDTPPASTAAPKLQCVTPIPRLRHVVIVLCRALQLTTGGLSSFAASEPTCFEAHDIHEGTLLQLTAAEIQQPSGHSSSLDEGCVGVRIFP